MIAAKDVMATDFISIGSNSTLAELIGQFRKKNETTAIVFEGKRYVGVATKKLLLTSRIDLGSTKVKKCIKKVPLLYEDSSFDEIARLLFTADVRMLPVIKDDKVIGVVKAKDILGGLKPYYKGVSVDKIAKMTVFCCNENDEVGKVINLMKEKRIDRVPLVGKNGRLAGIVSIIDVLERFHLMKRGQRMAKSARHSGQKVSPGTSGEKQSMLSMPISAVAEKTCCTAGPKDSVNSVIEEMIGNDVTSVVIAEKEKPIGIITVKDLLKRFAA